MLDGFDIHEIQTINSMYANGYVRIITTDQREMRLHVSDIAKMAYHFRFDEDMARHYVHLRNPKLTNKKLGRVRNDIADLIEGIEEEDVISCKGCGKVLIKNWEATNGRKYYWYQWSKKDEYEIFCSENCS